MTVRNKGPKTQRTSGKLGRRLPNADGVSMLVMNGVAVSGGAALATVYKLIKPKDATDLGLDAAYDTANKVLVYHHISRTFLRNPNIELYIFLCPQKVSTTHITPAVICDIAQAYVKKALDDAKSIYLAKIKFLAVAFNPHNSYVATITAGMDVTGATAKANLKVLLASYEDNYSFINAVLEARSYSGVLADLVNVEAISANLIAPRIRFVIAADPAISAADSLYSGYAAIGDELGMMSKGAISENYGQPIAKFNLTDATQSAFITAGLSGGQKLPTDNADLNSLESKGYIYAETVSGVDGIYFNDTRTCVIASDDYAYCENNRVIDKALLAIRTALTPLMTNARLQVDSTSGELTLSQKSLLESAAEKALAPLEKDGDISGGISCIIPSGINALAGEDITVEATFVPLVIGRAITIKAGFSNPF